ncbi:MAG: TaqI-like C-terminal specificity domain-containing protein [Phycisphaerae bacterium]|jgi:hypothetical protein
MSKTFEQGQAEVAALCKYFAKNQAAFGAPGRKEAHVRQDLIDPFFRALGWDVGNAARVAPQYCEVIVEDSLDIEGQQKAPDYTFRVGTLPKFYTEAKKCGVNIFADPAPAYQLRRYGWSAKVAVSILTDFEELGVYDCTLRPRPGDKASHARILYFRFDEYPDRWRELWDIFSHEAVWSGGFDQYAASKRKRGTSEVDVEFLKEIEGWRDALARNLALRNAKLSSDELNRAVQLTIDRIVFLRMAEDRGLEPCEQLLSLCGQADIYAGYMKLCRKADDKYNSGLFHFQKEADVTEAPDNITPRLAVDDKVFKPILQSLYFTHGSPYEFKVLPVEILGTVYERFLGKVIRLTPGHQAKIEEKPEVRKAGGVYYTPAYIVDYIVRQTVGRQIEGQSPAQLAGKGKGSGQKTFRVLDMACGSGSFLLGAYQCLLDHCLKWYIDNGPEGFPKAVCAARAGDWRLTIAEKKRILLAHIFGVDIDPQAVEVSKLSLLLKVLEGESAETIGNTMRLFHERALPNLSDNIKCGNSLIGPDYFTGRLIPDAEEFARVNAFDWKQAFPAAMKAGGFDCVIGNPPYGYGFKENDREYLTQLYKTFVWRGESYMIFIERAHTLLCEGGTFGYIIPDTYLNLGFTNALREFLLKSVETSRVVVLPTDVFADAVVDTTLLFSRRNVPAAAHEVEVVIYPRKVCADGLGAPTRQFTARAADWVSAGAFLVHAGPKDVSILKKMESKRKRIGDIGKISYGIKVYQVGKGNPPQSSDVRDEKPFTAASHRNRQFLPFYDGKHIARYQLVWREDNWLKYGPWVAEPRSPEQFEGEKILIRKIVGKTLIATYTPDTSYCNTLLYVLKRRAGEDWNYRYVLGVLNSRLFGWYIRSKLQISATDTFPQILIRDILSLPIEKDNNASDKIAATVDSMLSMHKQLASAKGESQRGAIQRQIEATDAEIDRLVYDLYGLTKEEIAIVEGTIA